MIRPESVAEQVQRLQQRVEELSIERDHWRRVAEGKAAGLTVRSAMKLFSVSRRTVYNWIKDKKVRVWSTPGGHPRLDVLQLLRTTVPMQTLETHDSDEK